MKKLTAFIFAVFFTCTACVSCEEYEPPEKSMEEDTTQSEMVAETEAIYNEYDKVDLQQGFSLKGQKYYYKGHSYSDKYTEFSAGDVLILTVTNETETDYKVSLRVTFFDENGEKVKTQSKSFDQFIAGYMNYFIFQPNKDYADYTCDLSLTELSDSEKKEIIVDKLNISFEGMIEKFYPDLELLESEGVQKMVPTLLGRTNITLTGTVPRKDVRFLFVLIDNTGEIYMICPFGAVTDMLVPSSRYIYSERVSRSKVIIPDELKGEIACLIFPVSILEVQF